ncbi:MAG: phage baseplate assembly protein V [Bacteroidota bacterium]
MAKILDISIEINGKNITQFSALTITQAIFAHHTFRLVCPTEAIDGTKGVIFNASKNMIGGNITISIKSQKNQGDLKFAGVITQIESAKQNGHAGDIIIGGYSPTVLLDNGPHCQTWEKKVVKNIAQDVVKPFPQNLLQPKISTTYNETLAYTVQYKETAWQFLCRLGATYGEWLYYDGQKMIMGAPQGAKIKLLYGNNLQHFNMSLHLRPAGFDMMAYDYMNTEVYDGSPSGIADKAGLNELGKHTLSKSEKFYSAKPKQWNNTFLTNKKQLDDYMKTKAAIQSSKMVRFDGRSSVFSLQLGGSASITGKNVYSDQDESFGDYTITSITHHCDGQGNYTNDFTAIPASVKMPPVNLMAEPHMETQSALVTDNNDPKGLGRVRVKFYWMEDSEKSPWLRIASPHGGDGKGMFFIPEVGEEVIVGFEGGSPMKPYVIGTVYNGKAKTTFANDGNDVKAIQTRSGNLIVMNDKEGSVHVADAKGNDVMIDGSGNIKVTSSDSIVLSCGDSKIEMKKDGTINITGKKITINADDKAIMGSKQAKFTADGGGGEATMEGMKAGVKGTTEAKIDSAQTTVSASGKVTVQAAMIMLN